MGYKSWIQEKSLKCSIAGRFWTLSIFHCIGISKFYLEHSSRAPMIYFWVWSTLKQSSPTQPHDISDQTRHFTLWKYASGFTISFNFHYLYLFGTMDGSESGTSGQVRVNPGQIWTSLSYPPSTSPYKSEKLFVLVLLIEEYLMDSWHHLVRQI